MTNKALGLISQLSCSPFNYSVKWHISPVTAQCLFEVLDDEKHYSDC